MNNRRQRHITQSATEEVFRYVLEIVSDGNYMQVYYFLTQKVYLEIQSYLVSEFSNNNPYFILDLSVYGAEEVLWLNKSQIHSWRLYKHVE